LRSLSLPRLRRSRGKRLPTCEEYVGLYLADFAHGHKQSSVDAQVSLLRRFREDFGGRSLDLTRVELKEWMRGEGRWAGRAPITNTSMSAVISLYYHAIDESELPLERNPASKLSKRLPRSAEEPPPTQREFEALVAACSTLGSYGKTMRALLLFAAYTLMRPSELCALEWRDIDFAAMRIHKRRRLYRGELDVPKTGPKLIALTAPARDAIKRLPRDSDLVFTSKTGLRLSTRNLGQYWRKVLEAAGLRFDFYHATKHYGVHYMWTHMRLSPRAIAAQAGWKLQTANKDAGGLRPRRIRRAGRDRSSLRARNSVCPPKDLASPRLGWGAWDLGAPGLPRPPGGIPAGLPRQGCGISPGQLGLSTRAARKLSARSTQRQARRGRGAWPRPRRCTRGERPRSSPARPAANSRLRRRRGARRATTRRSRRP
jgi:integrase